MIVSTQTSTTKSSRTTTCMKNAPVGNVERVLICMPFFLPCYAYTPRPAMLSPSSRLWRASHTRHTASVPARSRECTIWREREAR